MQIYAEQVNGFDWLGILLDPKVRVHPWIQLVLALHFELSLGHIATFSISWIGLDIHG